MDFETEEQQLEAIKNWWKKNAIMIVTGIALGVAAIFGNQYYQASEVEYAETASVLYEQVLMDAQNPSLLNEQLAKVNKLEAEFENSPYASLSALVMAKQQLNAGEVAKAQRQYEWVITNAKQDELKYLSKIRLARLLHGNKQGDQALALLNESFPGSFKAMVLELKGDVYLSKDNKDQAKVAYTQAKILSTSPNRWLQLKIDDIGDTTVNAKQTTEASEPSA